MHRRSRAKAFSPNTPHYAYHEKPAKNRSFIESLHRALRGIVSAAVWEANVRRQLLMFIAAAALGVWLQISLVKLIIVLLISVAVITLELVNSSLEALADAVHPDYHEGIQHAKDMAAGAVLIVSTAALAIGTAIFVPPLLKLFL